MDMTAASFDQRISAIAVDPLDWDPTVDAAFDLPLGTVLAAGSRVYVYIGMTAPRADIAAGAPRPELVFAPRADIEGLLPISFSCARTALGKFPGLAAHLRKEFAHLAAKAQKALDKAASTNRINHMSRWLESQHGLLLKLGKKGKEKVLQLSRREDNFFIANFPLDTSLEALLGAAVAVDRTWSQLAAARRPAKFASKSAKPKAAKAAKPKAKSPKSAKS